MSTRANLRNRGGDIGSSRRERRHMLNQKAIAGADIKRHCKPTSKRRLEMTRWLEKSPTKLTARASGSELSTDCVDYAA